ncbi:uncharacterized protein LOC121007839 [Bufo bufo]|uniref:uncharacterized protein LOC121007839 n=1 Tax=Bufo bufo TaxID=8384 RepID=UPI001ABECC96|nr:uncharacterized protein LOC121007839 [Bufo bufo]
MSDFTLGSLNLFSKSNFVPVINEPSVDAYISAVRQGISELRLSSTGKPDFRYPNLTTAEIEALESLRSDPTLTLKPADKGGAVVVMDTTKYVHEIMRQLNDPQVYRILDSDPKFMIADIIRRCLREALSAGIIDGGLSDFLEVAHPVTPVIYVLPKIHKTLIDPPGRPIVSGSDSIFSGIAFTLIHSRTEIQFLDTRVVFNEGVLQTELYTKPTDTNTFLCYNSSHPRRMIRSLPFSQFLRVKRVVSDENKLDATLNSMAVKFQDRDWCYTEESCGPTTWTSLGSCNGSNQSPIDIPVVSVQFNGSLGQFVFTNYSRKDALKTMSNTGHTVEIAIGDGVSISGAGLPAIYIATAFHFHWGVGTSGSEHRLSGRQYAMEMHVVHTKGGIQLSEAKLDPSGIAVLGFFIDVMDSANTSQLAVLSDLLGEVSTPGTTLQLNSSLSLTDLLGNVNLTMYYRYKGSLTTPTCNEVVLWTIFTDPITVPSKVVKAFSSAVKHVSGNLQTMLNNFRPPQPLNGRTVQASFPILIPLSPNSTAASNVTAVSNSHVTLQSSMVLHMSMLLVYCLTRF